MIFEKTLDFFNKLVKKQDPNKKYNEKMGKILSKLKAKKIMLGAQLENEKDERKRQNILQILKVISKQQKKGNTLIKEKEMHSTAFQKPKPVNRPHLSPQSYPLR